MYGYRGLILHVDLSTGAVRSILTEKYRRWGGGHGIGSALFWDFCKDKTIKDGRDPGNVICITTSPFSGTQVPSAGGRCEVVGVGVGLYPVSWFTRTNFGGRFSATLKYAGWDAIVITGKADKPVWIDIQNYDVVIHSAEQLWGKGTDETQQTIWALLDSKEEKPDASGRYGYGAKEPFKEKIPGWHQLPDASGRYGYSTQKPAILTIGPAGENQTAHGCLVHDSGNGAGQGGFGAVWGSKNLKAISVQGNGHIPIADPAALLQARFDAKRYYAGNADNPDKRAWGPFSKPAKPVLFCQAPTDKRRPQACQGCINGCRGRYNTGYGNEVSCQETAWYGSHARKWTKGDQAKAAEIILGSADLCNRYGCNTYPLGAGLHWLEKLHHEGIIGPGQEDKIVSGLGQTWLP